MTPPSTSLPSPDKALQVVSLFRRVPSFFRAWQRSTLSREEVGRSSTSLRVVTLMFVVFAVDDLHAGKPRRLPVPPSSVAQSTISRPPAPTPPHGARRRPEALRCLRQKYPHASMFLSEQLFPGPSR